MDKHSTSKQSVHLVCRVTVQLAVPSKVAKEDQAAETRLSRPAGVSAASDNDEDYGAHGTHGVVGAGLLQDEGAVPVAVREPMQKVIH